jgi:energy-coupling factor transport system ATP-binding protein
VEAAAVSFIRIDDVVYRYPTQQDGPALRGVSCQVERGQFVGVTGPADAGKTTLCRLIAGYVPHFFGGELSGSVSVGGVHPVDVPLADLVGRVGYVFENPFDQLTGASQTVFEEVAFALENMGLPRAEIHHRVEESLAGTGISDLRERHPGRLSGGQSQRLAIASVLAIRPEVLILDEPTSQLDPLGAEEVLAVVADLRAAGYTVVVVTQDLQRFAPHLDSLLVMQDGVILHQGPPRTSMTAAPSGVIRLPVAVELGQRARQRGLLSPDAPLPLTIDEAAAALALSPPDQRPAGQERGQASASPAAARPSRPPPAAARHDAPISVEALRYRYPAGVEALRGLSLGFDGGCVCIVGQNGAGKTSLVKHFNGLLKPTGGRVVVAGHDTRDLRVAQLARHVSLAFQNPDDQLFRRTVDHEVRFGPANLGYAEDRIAALADAAVRQLGLEAVRELRPHELGLPWRKRVAVASSVAMDAPVVVLDEPTGGQDAPGIAALGELIDALVADGRMVIVVTHDVEFAYRHATRVLALYQGGVLLDGTPRAVFAERELLARTHVEPPALVALAERLGLADSCGDIDEVLTALPGPRP